MTAVAARHPEVLLVEDNAADAKLTLEALKKSNVSPQVRHVEDGEEALAYVRNEGKYAAAERPSLILLDLNLPKIDGRSVLQQLKSDRRLRSIPIIVLTTSNDPEDVNRCYELQANGYVVKPFNYLEFTDQIKRLSDFWLSTVRRPVN